MDITLLIRGIGLILACIVICFLIPLLKNKLSTQQMEILYTFVCKGVEAAEQLFYSNQGKEKYQYVLDYLKDKGCKVDDDSLKLEFKTLIESAVKELRIEQGQRLNQTKPEGQV